MRCVGGFQGRDLRRADSLLAIGFSAYFAGLTEDGCRWDDPEPGIAWPCTAPILSARDAALPSYADLVKRLDGHGPIK